MTKSQVKDIAISREESGRKQGGMSAITMYIKTAKQLEYKVSLEEKDINNYLVINIRCIETSLETIGKRATPLK